MAPRDYIKIYTIIGRYEIPIAFSFQEIHGKTGSLTEIDSPTLVFLGSRILSPFKGHQFGHL